MHYNLTDSSGRGFAVTIEPVRPVAGRGVRREKIQPCEAFHQLMARLHCFVFQLTAPFRSTCLPTVADTRRRLVPRDVGGGRCQQIAAIGRPSALGHLSGPDGKRDLHRLEADGKSWSKVMLSFQDPHGLLLNKLRREFGRCQQQSWSCIRSLDPNTAVIRRPSCLTH